jgi:hypothetical protein
VLVKSELVESVALLCQQFPLGFLVSPDSSETNREQEPGAHPLVGETPEGKGPLAASPLVGEGAAQYV